MITAEGGIWNLDLQQERMWRRSLIAGWSISDLTFGDVSYHLMTWQCWSQVVCWYKLSWKCLLSWLHVHRTWTGLATPSQTHARLWPGGCFFLDRNKQGKYLVLLTISTRSRFFSIYIKFPIIYWDRVKYMYIYVHESKQWFYKLISQIRSSPSLCKRTSKGIMKG